jgi:Mce-associated membrane protein
MTGTLETPIYPIAEEGAAHATGKSHGSRTLLSEATVSTKATTERSRSSRAASAKAGAPGRRSTASGGTRAVKASRSRATASGAAGERAKGNGSVRAAQKVEELSANGAAATAEPLAVELPAVEPPVVQSADHEELQPSPLADGAPDEPTRRRAPSWVAVRSWVGSNLLLSCLAVALVVAVVLLTLTQLALNSEHSLNSARTSALAAAKGYAVDLASYNYQHLDKDFGKVLAESTPTFKQNFRQSSEALNAVLVRYDASASANVVAAGLVSATTSRAVALVSLNQTVENTIQKGKPTTESRVEITLLRSGGRWLIDEVTLL